MKKICFLLLVVLQFGVFGNDFLNIEFGSGPFLSGKNTKYSKLVFKTESDWLDGEWKYSKRYWHERGADTEIISWQWQNYWPLYFLTTQTFEGTYYSDSYELRFYDCWLSSKDGKPDLIENVKLDKYKYDLNEKLLEHYYYKWSRSTSFYNCETTTTTYDYSGDNINSIIVTYVKESSTQNINTGFETRFFYDTYDKILRSEYENLYTEELLERTNWEYYDSTCTAIKEVKDEFNTWKFNEKKIFYCNSTDDIVKEERYNWADSIWTQYQADSLFYHDNGLLKSVVTFTCDSVTAEYSKSKKTEYDYISTLTIPSASIALEATNIEYNSFTANWILSPDAEFYYLDVATDSMFWNCVDSYNNKVVPNVTSYSVTGLRPSTSYYYRVRAYNGFNSENSNVVEVTTADELFSGTYHNFADVDNSAMDWGDYDNDGDLDLLLTGYSLSWGILSDLYINDNGNFTYIDKGLIGVMYGSVKWGDYDNDGDMDILLTGATSGYYPYNQVSKVYRNDSGIFTDINAGLPGVYHSSVDWGDYDNDGDLDILLIGDSSSGAISKVYRNNSGVFTDINAGLIGVSSCSAEWGDYDNDGDLDVLIKGHLYRNDLEKFEFVTTVLTNSFQSAWGDYDNDGDLDILSGYLNRLIISANDSGEFTTSYTTIDSEMKSISWGDFDNDGDLDAILSGGILMLNESGILSKVKTSISSDMNSTNSLADYDNDGDIDILMTGEYSYEDPPQSGNWQFFPLTKFYSNNTSNPNTLPDSPINLISELNGMEVTFSWDKASDNETPQNGLLYNLYVGTTPGACDVMSPESNTSNGYRKVVELGNVYKNTSWTVNGLDPGTYYWSVQAIDYCYAGSPFAPEQTFTLTGIEDETLPYITALYQNYPNPFNPETVIKYSLAEDADVSLSVYDVAGREVIGLVKGKQGRGYHEAKFDGKELTSGMYIYKLSVNDKVVASKKMMMVK